MSDQDRASRVITTPTSGQEIVLLDYITGGEKRALSGIFIEQVKVNAKADGTGAEMSGVEGTQLRAYEDKMIETIVLAIDGTGENILQRLLDMRQGDYEFVLAAVNAVALDRDFEAKKV